MAAVAARLVGVEAEDDEEAEAEEVEEEEEEEEEEERLCNVFFFSLSSCFFCSSCKSWSCADTRCILVLSSTVARCWYLLKGRLYASFCSLEK